MRNEAKTRVEVQVGVEVLWKALAKDMKFILPKVVPNLVKDVELLEGDGGLGTIMLLNFGSDVKNVRYQKEKIVEFDEEQHKLGIQVVGGGHLDLGYTSYQTSFQLTETGKTQTQVDISVVYDTKMEEVTMPMDTTNSAMAVIKCLENYLLQDCHV
ncbi:hypothetical protein AQUCO_10200033v1 [Aquilegia coerulea]|uniref:Bet v I/Major latex protein domain-containing protein n=1 Tax=Aquilegia coerulea TaxID=218851 RepID=A0A2G5C3Y1_AQUCA|nr:hypothetical protein AQUCO_10200033v1 [Aquilegia coerulea]